MASLKVNTSLPMMREWEIHPLCLLDSIGLWGWISQYLPRFGGARIQCWVLTVLQCICNVLVAICNTWLCVSCVSWCLCKILCNTVWLEVQTGPRWWRVIQQVEPDFANTVCPSSAALDCTTHWAVFLFVTHAFANDSIPMYRTE